MRLVPLLLALVSSLVGVPALSAADQPGVSPSQISNLKSQIPPASGGYTDTYYINDHLATTIATIDARGIIDQVETTAFGAPLAAGRPATRYTGKPYDEDLGAYVFPFRNYRPEEARWMTPDPSGFPDGMNNREYNSSPNKYIDSYGLALTLTTHSDSLPAMTALVVNQNVDDSGYYRCYAQDVSICSGVNTGTYPNFTNGGALAGVFTFSGAFQQWWYDTTVTDYNDANETGIQYELSFTPNYNFSYSGLLGIIQFIDTNCPLDATFTEEYGIDAPSGGGSYFYGGGVGGVGLLDITDTPHRPYIYANTEYVNNGYDGIYWRAYDYVASYDMVSTYTIYNGGVTFGFNIGPPE